MNLMFEDTEKLSDEELYKLIDERSKHILTDSDINNMMKIIRKYEKDIDEKN